jgi:hypothetical protein
LLLAVANSHFSSVSHSIHHHIFLSLDSGNSATTSLAQEQCGMAWHISKLLLGLTITVFVSESFGTHDNFLVVTRTFIYFETGLPP